MVLSFHIPEIEHKEVFIEIGHPYIGPVNKFRRLFCKTFKPPYHPVPEKIVKGEAQPVESNFIPGHLIFQLIADSFYVISFFAYDINFTDSFSPVFFKFEECVVRDIIFSHSSINIFHIGNGFYIPYPYRRERNRN